jgi:hypothetical protein
MSLGPPPPALLGARGRHSGICVGSEIVDFMAGCTCNLTEVVYTRTSVPDV